MRPESVFLSVVSRLAGCAGRSRAARRLPALVLAAGLPLASCTKAQLEGQSPAYLIINTLEAASGAEPDEFGSVLASDVRTMVKRTVGGQEVEVPTIYEDVGRVSLRLGLRDPGSVDNPTLPSTANFVTINRYHVKFVRSDGRNVQGVDVPYEFEGAFTTTVGTGSTTAALSLVRAQAKIEAPLQALIGGGGAVMISTIAEVTFYGVDQAGRPVTAVGKIGVNFADWGDPS